jgi:uncharacterized membrane protein
MLRQLLLQLSERLFLPLALFINSCAHINVPVIEPLMESFFPFVSRNFAQDLCSIFALSFDVRLGNISTETGEVNLNILFYVSCVLKIKTIHEKSVRLLLAKMYALYIPL